ncbi:Nucleoside-diphosphate-sugar epimerase [Pseudomonas sp. URMO17WK12:I5]|uniref:NAD-dependent epimerase/dehydratase family protein n=2 Tax=Pseudomonas TaxID=286 RepID=UPI0005354128|nr:MULTISPECIES: NAD-dependent epimerase/dehydratase family protein [unclassified Pseudomonas]RAS26160.1 nucleoside-diphosphate-sugar epimerase [Pseudomonas sp. URMO17WK12:I7]SMF42220.1 Nucleoside-diphosphate-sugar epimerase [Pseudomonas sp. URMO17WK12:I5]
MVGPCRVMVTGASGFVGRHLCESLVQRDFSVKAAVRREPDLALAGDVVQLDLMDQVAVQQSLVDVDCVVHLAGRAHVLNDQVADPLAAFRQANVETTLALAEAALAAGVKRFIFVSSIGVNGNETTGQAFTEQSDVAPAADYAVSKLEAEQALDRLLAGTSMQLVVVRPPLIYDAGAPGNFARLLSLVAKGLPLPFAALDNRRSLVSLNNLISFLMLVITHDKAAGQLFLIADGASVSTRQIVSSLAIGMGRKARCFYMPKLLARLLLSAVGRRAMYVQLFNSLEVSTSKARDLLGWMPVEEPEAALAEAGRKHAKRLAVDAQ